MSPTIAIAVASLWLGSSVYLPSPHDKHGWGLRVHGFATPLFAGEYVHNTRFAITLLNFSKETREHDFLAVAFRCRTLGVRISDPDGQEMSVPASGQRPGRQPLTVLNKLRPGQAHAHEFTLDEFDYITFGAGRYRLEATLTIDGKTIAAPPYMFDVAGVPAGAVIASLAVPLGEDAAKRPKHEQGRPMIEQITVAGRTHLIFCRYSPLANGGKRGLIYRLAELPGKVEMSVKGASSAGGPVTLTYQDAAAPGGRRSIAISATNGVPWTVEQQEALREYEESRLAPAPRLVKP